MFAVFLSGHYVLISFTVLLFCWSCIQSADGDRMNAERLSATYVFALCRGINSELQIPDLLFVIVQELTQLPLDMSMDTLITGRDSSFNLLYRPLWSQKCEKTIKYQLAACNQDFNKSISFLPERMSGVETLYLLHLFNVIQNKTQWFLLHGAMKVRDLRDEGLSNITTTMLANTYNSRWSSLDRSFPVTRIELKLTLRETTGGDQNTRLEVGWSSDHCRMTNIRQCFVT